VTLFAEIADETGGTASSQNFTSCFEIHGNPENDSTAMLKLTASSAKLLQNFRANTW